MRLSGFDYASPGYYFATICTSNKIEWFGKTLKGGVFLNQNGKIMDECWNDLPNHYSNCELDYYIIMPNHFHGIVIITEKNLNDEKASVTSEHKSHSLSEIVRGFKSFSSRKINQLITSGTKFRWQNSFYDRVIRNEKELCLIRKYIIENPLKIDVERITENLVV